MRSVAAAGAVALLSATSFAAQDPAKIVPVRFAHGASSTAIKGSVRGHASVNYMVRARAGQTMTVRLTTSNSSNYFNVTAPGADAALFIGSSAGNRFSATIRSTGTYMLRVYLMRNAARRNERAHYTLNIAVL